MSEREAKHFCFRDANSTSLKYVALASKRGTIVKHSESALFSVSQMRPRLRPHATYVEESLRVASKIRF